MWYDEKFKHRRNHDTHEVTMWKDGSACDVGEATEARIEIQHGIYRTDWKFKWPEEMNQLEKLERMLSLAFNRGQRAKIAEVKKALDIQDPRR